MAMKSSAKVRAISDHGARIVIMVGLTFCLIAAMALHAHGDDGESGIETGSIKRDVMVAPVRRVFPKTPSDRDLNRLSKTAKAKTNGKAKKR